MGTQNLRETDYAFLLRRSAGDYPMSRDTERAQETVDFIPSLRSAAEFGQSDVIKQLLDLYDLDVNAPEQPSGRTALHYAALRDHVEAMSALMSHNGDCLRTDRWGKSVLHLSARNDGHRCLKLLLPTTLNLQETDNKGRNIWHFAALSSNTETFRILNDHVRDDERIISSSSNEGLAPIHYATSAGSIQAIEFFMAHGSDLFERASDSSSVLHCAMESRSVAAVKFLLHNGLDPCDRTEHGFTALHVLLNDLRRIGRSTIQIVKLLLRVGAKPCVARNDGVTPLQLLIRIVPPNTGRNWRYPTTGLVYTSDLLHHSGSDQEGSTVSDSDTKPSCDLEFSSESEFDQDGIYKSGQMEILQLFLVGSETRAYLKSDGFNVLQQLCQLSRSPRSNWLAESLRSLLNNGLALIVKDRSGTTAIEMFISHWREEGLQLYMGSREKWVKHAKGSTLFNRLTEMGTCGIKLCR